MTMNFSYWNDEWCSLGRKTAGHDTLVYVEVPKNALLWLHNHTQGRKSGFLRMKTESRFGGNMGWIVRMKKKMQEFMANDTARSICDACPLMFLSIDDAPFV